MDDTRVTKCDIVVPELYFLISKFLTNGPFQSVAQVLIKELERHKILPRRTDWTGQEHEQSFQELERKYSHIGPQHLLQICNRIAPILEKELVPSVPGVITLLGAGKQSLLRTKESITGPKSLIGHCTRLHSMPLLDPVNRKTVNNIVQVLYGRHSSGPITRKLAVPTSFYSKQVLLRRTLGHLSAVYCVLFDRSGKYIITGADDLLVKLWSAIDGRLLTTFRGASAEITDIAINLDNTLMAAGSLDRILRVWDMQTAGPIAVLSGHTGMITSVNFCPSPKGDLKYLVTTSTDGSVAFWQYSTPHGGKASFASKPIQYHEKLRPGQAQMICASFSPGGIFLAAASADHHVRVYIMSEEGPKRILETEAHSDTVDSIQWAHEGLKFISGSKDGMALVWHFESQQWKSLKLNMSERLPGCQQPDDDGKKLKVTMVSWDYTDKWVITAVNDYTIKVWNAVTGKLHKVMLGHTDELYVLESHPKDPHVLISAGHDGQLFIWNIMAGEAITSFVNHIEGQGHGGVFDAKWSPDGSMIAATDSHGHILMYGFGSGHERLKILPKELFFHTDYRPLIRDANHFVMDEQTQTMPHLMPPPFLVDVDGNPHPPLFQRLVPGRENCTTDQLIPNIAVGPEGVEVISNTVSNIDRLIAALANRQGPGQAPDSNNDRDNAASNNRSMNSPRANGSRVGLRRTGDVEGVRQSSGNWQRENNFKWIRRIYVQPLQYYRLQAIRQAVYVAGQHENAEYKREMRRRPMMINTSNAGSSSQRPNRIGMPHKRPISPPSHAYRTRAVREREHMEEVDDPDNIPSASSAGDDSSDTTAANDLMSESSGSETASSDYSDWVAYDQPGQALEPPKRSKRKPVQNRSYSPNSDSNQNNNKAVDKKKIPLPENGEIPEFYRPPEWLSEVIPRKAPYYPQMGDEVVYFRQGHQRYLEAVRNKKVYKMSNNTEPWAQYDLREHEVVKVIGIKYEIRPPRLCCLKLALMKNDGTLTGQSFSIKYHDMPDVLDFIVLRQTYDTAVRRLWVPGDSFRCMIDDGWWVGRIESRVALSSEFPNSLFMCFRIRWDNGEYEFMSPWDMEPIDKHRLPAEIGGAVPVLPEELRATLYQPKQEEWPRGDRDATCRRIIAGLEQVMGLAIADPFLAPVDLNIYPGYAYVVEYPIDLATIKARFENHFYRRITSAQFDVRYLATNAEKFNQSHSHIVKHARIITDLCLRIIKDHNDVDVRAVYHQLVDTYVTSDSENENVAGPSTSTGSVTRSGTRRSKRLKSEDDWRVKCRELLEMMWLCDDSSPFREPVDTLEHPDYLQCVDTPMDLRTVKEDLLGGNYETHADFIKDMRLIFTNSRNYNTNKRSRIYSMTLRLSNLFEAQLKTIAYSWKSTKRRPPKKKSVNTPSDRNRPSTSKMTTRATSNATGLGSSRQYQNSHDSDDDDDDDDNLPRNGGRPIRRNQMHSTNGVSSSHNIDSMPGPSTSNSVSRRQISRSHSQENDRDSNSSLFSSSSSSEDSEDSTGIPLSLLGQSAKQRKKLIRNSDSEDSYKPNRKKAMKKTEKRGKKKSERKMRKEVFKTNGRPVGRPPKTRHTDDDEDYREYGSPKKRQPKRSKRNRTESSNNSGEDTKQKRSKKSRRYESDHSYHLNSTASNMRLRLESDSENEPPRPTRSSIKKAQNAWGKEDSLEEPHDDEVQPQATSSQETRRRYQRRKPSESEHSQEERNTSQNRSGYRPVRTTRNRVSQEESEDDQVLSQLSLNSGFRTRPRRNYREEPHSTNGSVIPRTREITRRQIPITNRRSPATLIETTRISRSHVQEEHDYGEPGPSSLRHTRRTHVTLSRHQRNADELDLLTNEDPLRTLDSISARLRHRQLTVSSTPITSTSTNERNLNALRNLNNEDDDDDVSDPDDNKPLRYVALPRLTSNTTKSGRTVKKRIYSDDDNTAGPSTSRSTRTQKRPYYNEDSDESVTTNQALNKKRLVNTNDEIRSVNTHSNHYNMRHQVEDNENSDSEQPLSVSSRGRVRKITAKARGLFRD